MASAELLRFGNGRTVVSHCAGDLFSAAIDDNGQLYLWASEEDQDDHVETIPNSIFGTQIYYLINRIFLLSISIYSVYIIN